MRTPFRSVASVAALILPLLAGTVRADSTSTATRATSGFARIAGIYFTDADRRDACSITAGGDGVVKLVSARYTSIGFFDEREFTGVLRAPDGTVARTATGAPAWLRAVPGAGNTIDVTRWIGPAPSDVAHEIWTRSDIGDRPAPPAPGAPMSPAARGAAAPGPARTIVTDEPGPNEYVYVEELPEAIHKVAPEYPAAARAAGVQGTVMVKALVGKDGLVRRVEVVNSIPALDEAALASVKQWRFKPAKNKGEPVSVWISTPVSFRLK